MKNMPEGLLFFNCIVLKQSFSCLNTKQSDAYNKITRDIMY